MSIAANLAQIAQARLGSNPNDFYGITVLNTSSKVMPYQLNLDEFPTGREDTYQIPTLDVNGKLKISQMPDGISGGLTYSGLWNAATNSPTVTSSSGTLGHFYKVSVAGTTSIDGNSSWAVNDLLLFDGVKWDKIEGGSSEVLSVNGKVGTVVLTPTDFPALATLASPAFTGNPTAPTPTAGDNDTSIATTAFVHNEVATATTSIVSSVTPGFDYIVWNDLTDISTFEYIGNFFPAKTISITPPTGKTKALILANTYVYEAFDSTPTAYGGDIGIKMQFNNGTTTTDVSTSFVNYGDGSFGSYIPTNGILDITGLTSFDLIFLGKVGSSGGVVTLNAGQIASGGAQANSTSSNITIIYF